MFQDFFFLFTLIKGNYLIHRLVDEYVQSLEQISHDKFYFICVSSSYFVRKILYTKFKFWFRFYGSCLEIDIMMEYVKYFGVELLFQKGNLPTVKIMFIFFINLFDGHL